MTDPADLTSTDPAARMHAILPETVDTVDEVLDYARRRALGTDIPLDKAMTERDLFRLAGRTITSGGIGARRATAVFENVLAPACLTTDHPGYLAFIPSAPSKAASAFDVIVSASAVYGGSWIEGSGAVYAENEVLHWLAAEFGLPEGAGGVFMQGGTIGNLSALVAARDVARRRFADEGRARPDRWVVVCSSEAHSSITSAAEVMDVDVVGVPTGDDGRLHGDAVEAALDEFGDAVFAVVATGGTTNFGIVDDIASVAAVTKPRGVWLHIDGAYGLAAMLVEGMRPLFAGVEHADSLIVDPHKWLFAPFDACALIYRDPAQALRAHTQRAEYLDTLTDAADWNPSDLGIQLTRRARGLPMWFSLATHGTERYRAAIDHGIRLARQIADEIAARPSLSLVRDPQLSIVVFRREGWTLADYDRWSQKLLDDQIGFVVPSSHNGEPVVRFAIINPLTTFELLVKILDTME
ncbi:aminotransferase class V-fold PLP-dependent enzyme [Schumannella luteola]|uniref:Glutamate/tyrosine decarboxylase-like PLP-dependent enzyme n=1 Tax=Schumannella luteola TaxID=472059 RepID=A0A852YHE8_9MICO|nr:aminotransferase class V-fold PLP-dependent enzyme [Schumannella luteola]NYH00745.1 glutamate/tyrosine decarboxylase-like PLP-dependent enzyme [Schumannella luteola]TPX03956.1 aspartate aminotransferase family protein [Schumannella luteola]